MVRIFVADDHRIALMGLKHFLSEVSDIGVVGEATTADEVLDGIQKIPCDLLILDISMPGSSGLELLLKVRKEKPDLKVLILTMHAEEEYAAIAIKAGAKGYLMKGCTRNQLLEAIRQINSGMPYLSRRVAEELKADMPTVTRRLPHERLSDRQLEVFALLVNGMSLTKIGEHLDLSIKTIGTHKVHIMQKMGMSTVAELAEYAARHGLLPGENIS